MTKTSVFDESVKCSGDSASAMLFKMLEDLAGPWELSPVSA